MIRVLVVDDSPTMRALLTARLGEQPDIQIIGTAGDAQEARVLIREGNPDVVTLDLEMPGMNGLDFLDRIMRLRPTPVVIVSDSTDRGAQATVRALELGAIGCHPKRELSGAFHAQGISKLADLIREAAVAQLPDRVPVLPQAGAPRREKNSSVIDLIAVGASTGGIEALPVVLGAFPADCPPTMVVQHINPSFAEAVAKRLDEQCAPRVVMAEDNLPLLRGHIYFAPGGERHLQVSGTSRLTTRLRRGELVSGHRPSVDALFHSIAEHGPVRSVGILLTGMGADGAQGLLAMRDSGCRTIAQDKATSTIFGMPRAAIELGAAEQVLGLPDIARHVFARGDN